MSTSSGHPRKDFGQQGPYADMDLRRIIDTLPHLVWSAFPDGSMEFFNRPWLEYTGMTAEEAQGWGWTAALHPEDVDQCVAKWRRDIEEGVQAEATMRLRAADGTFRWFLIRAMPLRNDEGRIVRLWGSNTDIDERKRTEEALIELGAELAESQRLAGVGSWQWDPETDTVIWSEELYRLAGIDPSLPAVSYQEHPKLYTAESWERLRPAVDEALRSGTPYELELEMIRADGDRLWIVGRGDVQRDATGRIVRLHGTVQDITERKLAEAALRNLSGRLIAAHEEERAHIARELHDDLSQRMALLQISVERFRQETAGLSPGPRRQLHDIAELATEVSASISDLSHELHPSKLDVLGLGAALRSLCREFSEQHSLKVQFVHSDIPREVAKDVSLCLFRIVQEALRNVVRHSGAAQANVQLSGHDDRIDLWVSDSGMGFDPSSPSGLGITSMRERLRLLGGHLTIESEPSRGTQLRVHIPLMTTAPGLTTLQKAHATA